MKSAIVIGSGIGGLASALRLKQRGYAVHVCEANAKPGGKINLLEKDGYRFDMGPSLFTLPHLVDELYQIFDLDPKEYFNYRKKEVICNYFWEDGQLFQAKSDGDVFIREAAEAFGEDSGRIRKYLRKNARKYELTSPLFLEKSLHRPATYLSTGTLKAVLHSPGLDLMGTVNGTNRRMLRNPRLIQLFNRYATYNGSSPYQAPGILTMIPHLEMQLGTYYPEGGMYAIADGLHRLALSKGIEFSFDCRVERITHDGRQVTGVETTDGHLEADLVVCNADVYSAYRKLLPDIEAPEKTLGQERSSSALIFYWGVKEQFPQLDLHNIFFSDNYRREFDFLFNQKLVYQDPTVYINITSKEEPGHAPANCENWFVMVNAPAHVGQDWDTMIAATRNNVIRKINRILGINLEELIETEHCLEPRTIESSTGSHQGSLYGTSSNSRMAAFNRHPNFSKKLENLYFCGGSVHPGGGIPLALQSAKIVSNLIAYD